MLFFVVIDFIYLFAFLYPLLHNEFLWINPNREDLEVHAYFFLFFVFTLKISVAYIFIINRVFHEKMFKRFLYNALILNGLVLVASGISYLALSIKAIISFFSYYFLNGFVLMNVFYFLLFIIISISNRILRLRKQKIIRKLSLSEYEYEKLYDFIKSIDPEFEKHTTLYKFIRYSKFTNTYIIEQNSEILSCITFLDMDDLVLLSNLYGKELKEQLTIFSFLYEKVFKDKKEILLVLSPFFNERVFQNLAQGGYPFFVEWIKVNNYINEIKYIIENKINNFDNYFLRDFLINTLQNQNIILLKRFENTYN
ncbi:MAG: hypothetical protein NZ853_05560 [Leptospiraceae bacterium]|nr:hypothetical protein [Leptospiraceae bacterium]MDW7976585.1 hypothetical protein [Leptospiraceae bacterium]